MLKSGCYIIEALRKPLLSNVNKACLTKVPIAGLKFYEPEEPVDDSEWPTVRKLRVLEKQPLYQSTKPPTMPKMLSFLRGPEPVHNNLIYGGYGVKALLGGRLTFKHLEAIRGIVNKHINVDKMFAIWRVDSPWQPVCKRSTGKRMGGGKGSIHHYVTPVKADRIIVELGGNVHEIEAKKILGAVAHILPFASRVISQKELDEEKENLKWVKENNLNNYTMEYVIMNNMGGCQEWLSKYDYKWFGRYK